MLSNLWQRLSALVRMLWREVAKFGTVGGVAFLIDSAVFLWLLSGPMAGSEVKAKIVAGAVATVFSYMANRWWTFRHRRQSNIVREAVLFLIMNAIGLGIQAGCVFIAKYAFDITSTVGVFIAGNVIGLFFGTVFRYFAYRFWVFSEEMDADPNFARDRERLTGQLPVVAAQADGQQDSRKEIQHPQDSRQQPRQPGLQHARSRPDGRHHDVGAAPSARTPAEPGAHP